MWVNNHGDYKARATHLKFHFVDYFCISENDIRASCGCLHTCFLLCIFAKGLRFWYSVQLRWCKSSQWFQWALLSSEITFVNSLCYFPLEGKKIIIIKCHFLIGESSVLFCCLCFSCCRFCFACPVFLPILTFFMLPTNPSWTCSLGANFQSALLFSHPANLSAIFISYLFPQSVILPHVVFQVFSSPSLPYPPSAPSM